VEVFAAKPADMHPGEYGPFPYSPIINRPPLRWPNGARLAFWVIPNIEFFSLSESVPKGAGGSGVKPPDVPAWAWRDYGNRIGVFRMMDVMEKYGVRGTVALNSDLCERHPEIIAEGNKRGWEWMGHNESNTRRLNEVSADSERGIIQRALDTIERASGTRPKGWLSSGLQETFSTVEYLAAAGVEYVCDWVNDDQPYEMHLPSGRPLLSVPYSWEVNDKPAIEGHHFTPNDFRDMICRQFDVLYREGEQSGRVMAVALHPYITGQPFRIGALEEALAYVSGHAGVWLATGSEIAAAYREAMRQ
jgi:peptidoglycan/xylan/chitin deacetylase (PgdA/CDA1 family)